MKRKLVFALLAFLLLTPWPVAYAYDSSPNCYVAPDIVAAPQEATPRLDGYGNAVGGVTPGDLFYVDNSGIGADMRMTLYITNTDELAGDYRYMNLNLGIYEETAPEMWEKLGQDDNETFITMHNGMTSFVLKGQGNYKITIDRGCYYRFGSSPGEGIASPQFYLAAG
jgi:hypothetical protein